MARGRRGGADPFTALIMLASVLLGLLAYGINAVLAMSDSPKGGR